MLPRNRSLIARLAGYSKWLNFLGAGGLEWHSHDLQSTPQTQLLQFFGSQTLAEITLFQVRHNGEDWDGESDRDSYLCLCEGEARMVVGQLRGPKPKTRRLYFEHYLQASYRPVTLAEVLASAQSSQRLARRLRELTDYSTQAYERADAAVFWLEGGTSMNLLFCDDQLIPPTQANKDLHDTLSWGRPICVWNSDGLGGVMAVDGCFLISCRFSYLDGSITGNCVEALIEPLPDVTLPLSHWDFLKFRCDIFDIHTARQVNSPTTPALVHSLSVDGGFVALSDHHAAGGRTLLGFMDTDGHWLGEPMWVDVLLFNEGLAAVQCPETGHWGFINRQGDTVITPQFVDGGYFNDGLAFVQKPSRPKHWYAINTQGEVVTGPWRSIDHWFFRDMILVQDDQDRWALLDKTGKFTLDPHTLPDGLDENERLKHLADAYRSQRQALVTSLMDAPLHRQIAELKPQTKRDLTEMNLWRREISVSALPEHWQVLIDPAIAGRIGWEYPVSDSLFDLTQEAPVIFTKMDGETVGIGVPWQDIELRKPSSE